MGAGLLDVRAGLEAVKAWSRSAIEPPQTFLVGAWMPERNRSEQRIKEQGKGRTDENRRVSGCGKERDGLIREGDGRAVAVERCVKDRDGRRGEVDRRRKAAVVCAVAGGMWESGREMADRRWREAAGPQRRQRR
ncbi:hypothetical protein ACLOJK_029000 [Asimina triloba]